MLRLIHLGVLAIAAAIGQTTYPENTWSPTCTSKSHASMPYNDVCPAANAQPVGTHLPPLNVWSRDPVFGSPIMRLGDICGNTNYAAYTGFSATGKYVMVYHQTCSLGTPPNSGHQVYNRQTGAWVRSGPAGASDGKVRWSTLDDDVMYYSVGSKMYKFLISTGASTELFDISGNTGISQNITEIWNSTGDVSKDDWWVFGQKSSSDTVTPICIVHLAAATPLSTRQCRAIDGDLGFPSTATQFDFALITVGPDSTTGMRYVLVMSGSTTYPTNLYKFNDSTPLTRVGPLEEIDNPSTGDRDGIWEAGETGLKGYHSAVAEEADGSQVYVRTVDGGSNLPGSVAGRWIAKFYFRNEQQMTGWEANGGGLRLVGYQSRATPWHANHTGCAKKSPYCVVSTNGGTPRTPGDTTTPLSYTTSQATNILAKLNGTKDEIKRVSHTFMVPYTGDTTGYTYWLSAKSNLSPDGRFLGSTTNFGVQNALYYFVTAMQGDEKAVRVNKITANTATLRYSPPTTATCTVVASVNENLSAPLINSSDTVTASEREFSLTGMAANTQYYGSVTCGGSAAPFRLKTKQ